jgi:membrane-bound inhibitor of C-type lysozyme
VIARQLLSLAAAFIASAASAAEQRLATVVYLCDEARVLSIVQPEMSLPGQNLELVFGSERKRMRPAIAASGPHYLSTDGTWEWWSKGAVSRLATASGSTLAQNCTVFQAVGRRPAPDK